MLCGFLWKHSPARKTGRMLGRPPKVTCFDSSHLPLILLRQKLGVLVSSNVSSEPKISKLLLATHCKTLTFARYTVCQAIHCLRMPKGGIGGGAERRWATTESLSRTRSRLPYRVRPELLLTLLPRRGTLLRCSRDPSVDINRGRGSSYSAGSVRGDVGQDTDIIDRVWWDRHDDISESGGFWEVPCDSSVEVEL